MKSFDWTKPQRQPLAGLTIVFINVIWEVLKRVWPFAILMLLQNKPGKVDRYEIIALIVVVFTITGAVLKFFFFRFYIEENKMIIKSGWLKKTTKVIPLEKIQTVNIEQGPVHQVMSIVKLTIDTAGSQKAEASIDALHKPMAEALRHQLLSDRKVSTESEPEKQEPIKPLVQLSGKDLLKLSISANHLETLLILLSFVVGLYENFREISTPLFTEVEDVLPTQTIYPILFLIIAVSIITIVVSTARIFFTFYDFKITRNTSGLQIRSGLLNVKERLISSDKIQFVSWKANWIRKRLKLWMLEYHIAGGDEMQKKSKVHLPVTRSEFIPLLSKEYFELPVITNEIPIRIHPSFFWRRLLIAGLLPSLIIIPLLWLAWEEFSLLFLIYTVFIGIISWQTQRKFRLWALHEAAYISKGWLGEERILLQWYKMQFIEITQSMFQRKRGLASVRIHTAGGSINISFISVEAAQQVRDYALYKTEASSKSWM